MDNGLEVAVKAAKIAGEKLEYYFESSLEHHEKEDTSIVTEADIEADDLIIKEIQANFPDHQILSEEKGEVGPESDYVWVIDPLDGTNNFSRGIPIFSTSVCLTYKKAPIASVVYNPVTNTLFTAEKGKGAFWNGEKIKCSSEKNLKNFLICFGRGKDPRDRQSMKEAVTNAYPKVKSVRLLMSASLELAYVASGRVDAFVVLGLHSWDFIGGLLLVEEAGGRVTNLDVSNWGMDSTYILASNGKSHKELLEILNVR